MRVALLVVAVAFTACASKPEIASVDTKNEPTGSRLVTVQIKCNGRFEAECESAGLPKVTAECGNLRPSEISSKKTPELVTIVWRCNPR